MLIKIVELLLLKIIEIIQKIDNYSTIFRLLRISS